MHPEEVFHDNWIFLIIFFILAFRHPSPNTPQVLMTVSDDTVLLWRFQVMRAELIFLFCLYHRQHQEDQANLKLSWHCHSKAECELPVQANCSPCCCLEILFWLEANENSVFLLMSIFSGHRGTVPVSNYEDFLLEEWANWYKHATLVPSIS